MDGGYGKRADPEGCNAQPSVPVVRHAPIGGRLIPVRFQVRPRPGVWHLPIDAIDGPVVDYADLLPSVREWGIIEPILVRPAAEAGRYVLVHGRRRLAAARAIGTSTIPCVVQDLTDAQAQEVTRVRN